MAPIEKELKEMDGKKSFLLIMDATKLQGSMEALIRFLAVKKGMSGAVICLNKPYKSVKASLESKKISTKGILFIDTLSSTRTDLKPKGDAIMISNPSELTSISLASRSFIKSAGSKFIIIDALSTLLIYNQPDAVAKFVRYLISFTSSEGIKVIVLTTESPNDRILPKVQPFFDKISRV